MEPQPRRDVRAGLVSTILPVHNRSTLLAEALESVLAQTYRPIEVIIVDDGSTDETRELIAGLERRHSSVVRAMRQENRGPGAARETGRAAAAGEFIQYLDSDDLLLPKKFELQASGLRARPDCDVAYGKTRLRRIGSSPEEKPLKRTGERIATMFPSFLESRWWSTSTPLYRRSVVDRAGPWKPLRNEEDWEYDCRVASLGIRLFYCSELVSETREHDGPRLSRDSPYASGKLRDRATAHELILSHARRAGISAEQPEMRHFARELFLLARQCGAHGLSSESRKLFELARSASEERRAAANDFRLYELLARLVGWTLTGKLACATDRFRRNGSRP